MQRQAFSLKDGRIVRAARRLASRFALSCQSIMAIPFRSIGDGPFVCAYTLAPSRAIFSATRRPSSAEGSTPFCSASAAAVPAA